MNTKTWLLRVFLIPIICLSAGNIFPAGRDTVILLDTSHSVLSHFGEIQEYLVDNLLERHIYFGEAFHVLSFSNTPRIEVNRRIESSQTIKEIRSNISYLYPLGVYSDLINALKYLYQYVYDLPVSTQKRIILITDGLHNPPPDSPFYSTDSYSEISLISRAVIERGWTFHILKVPASPLEGLEKEAAGIEILSILSSYLKTEIINFDPESQTAKSLGYPTIRVSESRHKTGRRFKRDYFFYNPYDKPLLLRLSQVKWKGQNILEQAETVIIDPGKTKTAALSFLLPEDLEEGENILETEYILTGDSYIFPVRTELSVNFSVPRSSFFSKALKILLMVLAVIFSVGIIISLVIFMRRFIEGTLHADFNFRQDKNQEKAKTAILAGKNEKKIIEMAVEGQNPYSGFRNLSTMTPGTIRTVGGKNTAYSIIIIKIPETIAELTYDGTVFNLKPIKSEYFDSPETIIDCLNRPIKVKDRNSRSVSIVFKEWESPADRINRLMHQTDKPGSLHF